MKNGFSRVLTALALLVGFSGVQAATVSVSDLMDGNGSPSFFDVATTTVLDNVITVGINNFTADGSAIATSSAVDTLSMTITAPAGFFITSISYTEEGNGKTEEGVAAASGSLVADGTPVNFLTQLFAPNSESGWTITPASVAIANKESIDLNITNSLFAFAFAGGEIAEISKTAASITVGLTAIPIPPAIWMMGAAIAALVTVGRRDSATA